MTNFGEPRPAHRRRRARRSAAGARIGRRTTAGPPARRPARASASSSPTPLSTGPAARGWPAGSGWAWPAPARSAHHGSGEIFLATVDRRAASTATAGSRRPAAVTGRALDPLFAAVVEASEEAVLNSMLAVADRGRAGRATPRPARPPTTWSSCSRRHGRLVVTGRRPRPARSGSRWTTASSWPPRSTCPTRRDGPQPCLLEALPYRKDDLTSSYRREYVRLRDEHGYAVCRLDLRGTGSSGGDATDEYPPPRAARPGRGHRLAGRAGLVRRQRRHVRHVVLRLQLPADGLRAAAGSSRRSARSTPPTTGTPTTCTTAAASCKLLDLVDYCHYMTPMNALPPVPAVWGDGWREEWLRRVETNEPWLLTWLREQLDGPYWRHGSRAARTTSGSPARR